MDEVRPDMGDVEAPAPEPEPTPEAQPEKKEEKPDWVTAPIPDEPQYQPPQYQTPQFPPQYGQPMGPPPYPPPYPPQYVPPAPYPPPYPGFQPLQPMTPQQQAAFDWRAFADRPQEILQQQVMQGLLPVAARLQQLDAQIQQVNQQSAQLTQMTQKQHEDQIVEGFNRARGVLASAYKDGFSKDPAYANEQVRQTLDVILRGYLKDAVTRAYTQRDFSGLRNLSDPRVLQTAFTGAKLMAGWQETGTPVSMQGAFLESSRSQTSSRADLDEDERDAAAELARRMGVDRSVIEKRMIDGKETRRKLGW